jgi:RNA polymerase sigma-70 factor (sigma-E family)
MSAMVVGHRAPAADEGIIALYSKQWAPMVRLAWLLTSDQSVAEEIVQDALVAMHRRWSELEDVNAEAYLRTSVVNRSRSALRHRRVVERQAHDDVASGRALGSSTAPSAESHALDAARHDALVDRLRMLPRRQREVLTLRYYLDLSEAEIAATLDIAPGSVKAHAHRGLATLRAAVPQEDLR